MNKNKNKLTAGQRWILVLVGMTVGIAAGIIYNNGYGEVNCLGELPRNGKPRYELNKHLVNDMSRIDTLQAMDKEIERYLKRWEINGASLAISRGDSLVYAKGYGFADVEKKEQMEPSHLLRVASVSKLLTAVAIMKLTEEKKLDLSDHVFGPEGVLNDTAYTSLIKDPRYFDITVEQLLRHEGGFNNAAGDPMFSTRFIMMQNHLSAPPTSDELIRIILRRRLGYTPGQGCKYSNFGYMLLSRIIERRSGMKYEQYMQRHLFNPAGCYDIHLARNYYEGRRANEVHYYMHDTAEPTPEFNNSGRMVVKCYGENDIERLYGAGGWCASAPELCRFIASIDGRKGVADIISEESVKKMTEDLRPAHGFSLGWNTTPAHGPWVRTGTLSGTSALVVLFPEGECWVMITNTSTWRGHGFAKESIGFFDKLRKKYATRFPKRTLWPM